MRLLVCGSRTWALPRIGVTPSATRDEAARVYREIANLRPDVVIHGGAKGADECASYAAVAWSTTCAHGVVVYPYDVEPTLDGPWPGAGPRRNARMLRDGKPDRGLAFGALWRLRDARPGYEQNMQRGHGITIAERWRHTGTGGMCALMLAAGLPVRWVAAPGAAAVDLVTMPTPGEGVA